MTRVKICGITNVEDARAAVDYGADALGFIFVPDTPRYIGGDFRLTSLLADIPPFVAKVAVCMSPGQIVESPELMEFNAAQFYQEDGFMEAIGGQQWIYACRIKNESSLTEIILTEEKSRVHPLKHSHALLLDTYHKDKLGGSGETFNWDLAVEAKKRFNLPIILAGGLTADNVEEAIAKVQPYAVDVSSGVEAEPGRKDHAKLRAFIRAVRRADL